VVAELAFGYNVPDPEQLRAELVPRYWAMARLETWLRTEDSRIFLVTGLPGSGKTSFAAQLALFRHDILPRDEYPSLSSAELVLAHFCDSSNERTLDPLEFVSRLSQALAHRIPHFAEAVADAAVGASAVVTVNSTQTIGTVESGASVANVQIRLPRDVPTRQAFAHLVRRPLDAAVAAGWHRQILVVVDDLSSGHQYDSDDNIARLIGLAAGNPAELPDVLRFVVTSRSDPWVLLDLPPRALDLHDDQPPEQDDIRRYVSQRMAVLAERTQRQWVDHVTAAADGNFLYARHTVDQLLNQDGVLDQGPAAHPLPEGLTELYRRWIAGGPARSRDRWWNCHQPVLSALTVAQGAGLTRKELAGITGLPKSQVQRAVEECAQFLLGGSPDGPVRLYHDSFRDFLAAEEVEVDEAHRAVTNYFVTHYGSDWLAAEQYARDHLVTHAVATGDLASLVARPDFLVVAEPTAVLHALASTTDDDSRATAYQRTGWLLADRSWGERATYLELAAFEIGDDAVAAEFGRLSVERAWFPLWVSVVRHRPGRIVGTHLGGVLDMLTFSDPTGTTIVTCGDNGTVRFWDLRTHTLLGAVDLPSTTPAAQLAVVDRGGQAVLLVTAPREVWVVDLKTYEAVDSMPTRADSSVTAVATVWLDDVGAIALGYADGAVQVVEPAAGESLIGPLPGHEGPVLMFTSEFTGGMFSVGGDGKVIDWRLVGDVKGEVVRSLTSPAWANAIMVVPVADEQVLWAVGYSDGYTDWTTRSAGGDESQVFAVAGHDPASWRCRYHWVGGDLASSGHYSMTTSFGSGSNSYGDLLRNHQDPQDGVESDEIVWLSGGVNSVDLLDWEDQSYLATGGEDGRVAFVASQGDEVSLEYLLPAGEPVSTVAFSGVDGRNVLLSAEFAAGGTIREWSLTQATSPLPPLVGELSTTVVDFDSVAHSTALPIVAIAYADGTVGLREGPTERSLGASGFVLVGVRLWRWGSRLCVVAFGQEGAAGAVRVWSIEAPSDPIVTDMRFDDLTVIRAVTSVGDIGDLLVAGDWTEPTFWRLAEKGDGWSRTAVPLGGNVHPLVVGQNNDPQWMVPVAGSGGREVLVGGQAIVHHLSANGDRISGYLVTSWMVPPISILHEGEPALLSGHDGVVRIDTFDELKRLGEPDLGTFLEIRPTAPVHAIAAVPDGSVIAAGTGDGRLLVWRGSENPDLVVQFGSAVRKIVAPNPDTVIARTDLGIYAIRMN
jgi:WD40 repeat protein